MSSTKSHGKTTEQVRGKAGKVAGKAKGAPTFQGKNKEAEKIKHGYHPDDETGAPKGKNRSNAGEETS